jgi:hypothetical protein
LKFKCPYCRREIDLLDVQEDNDLVSIVKTMAGFGRHGGIVWAYMELFGNSPLRSKRKKLLLLLQEMKILFEGGEFLFQKKRYKISQPGISEALNIMAHRQFETPLDSHNYLKKIMIGISDREAQEAGRQAEKVLRKKEEILMTGRREPDPTEVEINKKRIKELVETIG